MVKPSAAIAANAPMMVTGTVVAPVLQEQKDHDQHEQTGFDQGFVDFVHGSRDEFGGVERRVESDALREGARKFRHLLLDRLLHLQRVGAGRLEHAYAGGRLVVELENLAISLRAELDGTYISYPRHVAIVAGLDDDVLELARILQPSVDVERVLESLARRRRRAADLSGGDLLALLLDGLDHVLRNQVARLQLVGIEPDAHGILAGAEDRDIADA
jgi:hypothetical protein